MRNFLFGNLQVVDTGRSIKVGGTNFHALMKDIGFHWETSVLERYMFKRLSGRAFEVSYFFAPDFLYMMEVLRDTHGIRTPKRLIIMLIRLLKSKTWLSRLDVGANSITDLNAIKGLFPYEYKSYQVGFIKHFGVMVPTYGLKGYMLDAGPGTGKTITNLALGKALGVDRVIVVAPMNSVDEVWRHTIDTLMRGNKRPAWVSSDEQPVTLDHDHYVVHYEYLAKFLEELRPLSRRMGRVLVVLDESHNFNRIESQRTELFIELCSLPQVQYVNYASGTPIMAVGQECIPFLRVVAPDFNKAVEENFRKIYGRSARKANEILRNRIGHLKYHVPKSEAMSDKPLEYDVPVKIKNGDRYTLANVAKMMRKFMEERKTYYEKHRVQYETTYTNALKHYEEHMERTPSARAEYAEYRRNVGEISAGFDPRTMREISMMCNRYERTKIIPTLPPSMKQPFRDAKSVVKYVNLKIMGEALGGVVGRMRTECNIELLHAIDFTTLINSAEKKTLIFTNYVEVLEETDRILRGQEFLPILVYGDTNRDLSKNVRTFYKDPAINPMIATIQSLSTAVPITCANNIIFLNQPFRSNIKLQAVSRAHRLGQDTQVTVHNVLLDTGDQPNLSTRSNDILEWSREQVSSIMGVENVDIEELSMESDLDSLMDGVEDSHDWLESKALPHSLYQYIDSATQQPRYTDSRTAATLGIIRNLTGLNIPYDNEADVYYGIDQVLETLNSKIEIAVIKPQVSEQWIFIEGPPDVTDALYYQPLAPVVPTVISSVTVDLSTLTKGNLA